MNIILKKFEVCVDCFSTAITHADCRCVTESRYSTIELEFEVCTRCNRIIDDGNPADTEFNTNQLKTLE